MKNRASSFYIAQIKSYLLPVLVITFGLQFIRSFIPSLAWYLRDTAAVGTLSLIPYAFGTFLLGFLAPLIRRIAGARTAIWFTAGGLALVRIIEQICRTPGIDLWLNIAGIGLFLNFLPLFIGCTRESSRKFIGTLDLRSGAGICPRYWLAGHIWAQGPEHNFWHRSSADHCLFSWFDSMVPAPGTETYAGVIM